MSAPEIPEASEINRIIRDSQEGKDALEGQKGSISTSLGEVEVLDRTEGINHAGEAIEGLGKEYKEAKKRGVVQDVVYKNAKKIVGDQEKEFKEIQGTESGLKDKIGKFTKDAVSKTKDIEIRIKEVEKILEKQKAIEKKIKDPNYGKFKVIWFTITYKKRAPLIHEAHKGKASIEARGNNAVEKAEDIEFEKGEILGSHEDIILRTSIAFRQTQALNIAVELNSKQLIRADTLLNGINQEIQRAKSERSKISLSSREDISRLNQEIKNLETQKKKTEEYIQKLSSKEDTLNEIYKDIKPSTISASTDLQETYRIGTSTTFTLDKEYKKINNAVEEASEGIKKVLEEGVEAPKDESIFKGLRKVVKTGVQFFTGGKVVDEQVEQNRSKLINTALHHQRNIEEIKKEAVKKGISTETLRLLSHEEEKFTEATKRFSELGTRSSDRIKKAKKQVKEDGNFIRREGLIRQAQSLKEGVGKIRKEIKRTHSFSEGLSELRTRREKLESLKKELVDLQLKPSERTEEALKEVSGTIQEFKKKSQPKLQDFEKKLKSKDLEELKENLQQLQQLKSSFSETEKINKLISKFERKVLIVDIQQRGKTIHGIRQQVIEGKLSTSQAIKAVKEETDQIRKLHEKLKQSPLKPRADRVDKALNEVRNDVRALVKKDEIVFQKLLDEVRDKNGDQAYSDFYAQARSEVIDYIKNTELLSEVFKSVETSDSEILTRLDSALELGGLVTTLDAVIPKDPTTLAFTDEGENIVKSITPVNRALVDGFRRLYGIEHPKTQNLVKILVGRAEVPIEPILRDIKQIKDIREKGLEGKQKENIARWERNVSVQVEDFLKTTELLEDTTGALSNTVLKIRQNLSNAKGSFRNASGKVSAEAVDQKTQFIELAKEWIQEKLTPEEFLKSVVTNYTESFGEDYGFRKVNPEDWKRIESTHSRLASLDKSNQDLFIQLGENIQSILKILQKVSPSTTSYIEKNADHTLFVKGKATAEDSKEITEAITALQKLKEAAPKTKDIKPSDYSQVATTSITYLDVNIDKLMKQLGHLIE